MTRNITQPTRPSFFSKKRKKPGLLSPSKNPSEEAAAAEEQNGGREGSSKIAEVIDDPCSDEMSQVSRARLYRRRRRSSQRAYAGSDHDFELKSIPCEPTTTEEEEEEEEEEDEAEEEEEEDDDEELAPESSMELQKEDFDQHRRNWEISFGKGRFGFMAVSE